LIFSVTTERSLKDNLSINCTAARDSNRYRL